MSAGRQERDAQAFWLSVLDSLRRTRIGSERMRELTAAPDLDGATVVRRLLEDLGSPDERLWLGSMTCTSCRLHVEGELTEIRGEELRFSVGESRAAGGGGCAFVRRCAQVAGTIWTLSPKPRSAPEPYSL